MNSVKFKDCTTWLGWPMLWPGIRRMPTTWKLIYLCSGQVHTVVHWLYWHLAQATEHRYQGW